MDSACLYLPLFTSKNRIIISEEEPNEYNNLRQNDIWIQKINDISSFYVYNNNQWEFIGNFGENNIKISNTQPLDPQQGDIWISTEGQYTSLYFYSNNQWISLGQLTNNHFSVGINQPEEANQGDIWINNEEDVTSLYVYLNNEWIELGKLTDNQFTVGTNEPLNPKNGDIWFRLEDDNTTSIITWINNTLTILGTLNEPIIQNMSNVVISEDGLPNPDDFEEGTYVVLPTHMGELNKKQNGQWLFTGLIQDKYTTIISNMKEFFNAGFEIYTDTVVGSKFSIDPTRGLLLTTNNTFQASISPPFMTLPRLNGLIKMNYYGTPNFSIQTLNESNTPSINIFTIPNKIGDDLYPTTPHWTEAVSDQSIWYSQGRYLNNGDTRLVNLDQFTPPRKYEFIREVIEKGSDINTNLSYADILQFTTLFWNRDNLPSPTVKDYQENDLTLYLEGSRIMAMYFFSGDATGTAFTSPNPGSNLESEIKYLNYNIHGLEYTYIFGDPTKGMPSYIP